MPNKHDYTVSSGKVFADLGLPRPAEALAKAELAHKISTILRDRRLTQARAGEILDAKQVLGNGALPTVVLGNVPSIKGGA